ncbi:hypothetical protein ASD54_21590 [Rhizobium sp. Root149]|uniref:hypothetical protein n=1 Tax=Rhizobium sp. Root149 TaxID=1736473 RepID=UPI0007144388|nr:hypothetical protein [Rhizobium sp. Root149]KQZ46617.1 hypothetical protein ASD54_21590 [Rhizobium sp. Root149]
MADPLMIKFIEEQIRIYDAMIEELERHHPELPRHTELTDSEAPQTRELKNLKASRRTLQTMLT